MSIEEKIAALKSLAALDARLVQLESEVRTAHGEQATKERERSQLSDRMGTLEGGIGDMERTRGSLNQELRQLATQVEKAREKMARCRNEREANAVSRELEELRRIQRERENEIQKLGELIEQARAEHTTMAETTGEQAALPAPDERPREIAAEIEKLKIERLEFSKHFDAALLRRYDAVRQKRGTGIAEVRKGTCMACHIQLSPMIYQQMLHRKELHTCPACLRILYLSAAPPEASEA